MTYGGFLKWWYPQNTPKWSFFVGKPMVVGYHHFTKHPYVYWNIQIPVNVNIHILEVQELLKAQSFTLVSEKTSLPAREHEWLGDFHFGSKGLFSESLLLVSGRITFAKKHVRHNSLWFLLLKVPSWWRPPKWAMNKNPLTFHDTCQFCWWPYWDGYIRDLLERLLVTSNDRGWKGHGLNHLVRVLAVSLGILKIFPGLFIEIIPTMNWVGKFHLYLANIYTLNIPKQPPQKAELVNFLQPRMERIPPWHLKNGCYDRWSPDHPWGAASWWVGKGRGVREVERDGHLTKSLQIIGKPKREVFPKFQGWTLKTLGCNFLQMLLSSSRYNVIYFSTRDLV